MEDYSLRKWKMKKTKRKEYYQGNKEKMQKRLREYNKNLSEDEENYAKIMNKNILDTNRKKKKRIYEKLLL